MCKPRFPKSVSYIFTYRAIMPWGDILESDNFKSLYRGVLRHLRVECLYNETEYKHACAEIEFGYYTHYDVYSGYPVEEWTNIRTCGLVGESTYTEWFVRPDGKYQQFKSRFNV